MFVWRIKFKLQRRKLIKYVCMEDLPYSPSVSWTPWKMLLGDCFNFLSNSFFNFPSCCSPWHHLAPFKYLQMCLNCCCTYSLVGFTPWCCSILGSSIPHTIAYWKTKNLELFLQFHLPILKSFTHFRYCLVVSWTFERCC